MRKAVIDVGSNSVRLLLAECEGSKIISATKQLEMTRLAAGVDCHGILREESMAATLAAFRLFRSEAEAFGAGIPEAFATSAVRDASNGADFARRAELETGVPVRIIPGELEAELGFLGVAATLPEAVERVLVVDIGGGSTECILGSRQGIEYARSQNVGAVRMTGRHVTVYPTPEAEIQAMAQDIDAVMAPVMDSLRNQSYDRIYGIGGTLTTAAAMVLDMVEYDPARVQHAPVTLEQLQDLRNRLAALSLDERRLLHGLQPKRADVIVAGYLIMERIMESLGKNVFHASDADNLEGILYKYYLSGNPC